MCRDYCALRPLASNHWRLALRYRRAPDIRSGQQRLHDVSVNVGQPVVAAFVAVGELFVIDAHQVQQRGVEVMHMHGIAHDVVAKLVGLAVDEPALEAAAGHPDGEAARMVIAPEIVLFDRAPDCRPCGQIRRPR